MTRFSLASRANAALLTPDSNCLRRGAADPFS